jgi:hypothetical protein
LKKRLTVSPPSQNFLGLANPPRISSQYSLKTFPIKKFIQNLFVTPVAAPMKKWKMPYYLLEKLIFSISWRQKEKLRFIVSSVGISTFSPKQTWPGS